MKSPLADPVFTGSLAIPQGASPTVDSAGEIAVDTTSDQLIYYGGAKRVIAPFLTTGFSYSTSTPWVATSTISLAPIVANATFVEVYCKTNTGTLNVSLYDGTNRANMFNASTTVGTITFTTNNTFVKGEEILIDIGTPATTPTRIGCRFKYTYDAD